MDKRELTLGQQHAHIIWNGLIPGQDVNAFRHSIWRVDKAAFDTSLWFRGNTTNGSTCGLAANLEHVSIHFLLL